MQMELWSVWLSGFVLIGLSLYATQRLLPCFEDEMGTSDFNHKGFSPEITIFTAAEPFTGSAGTKQSLAVRSWLGLSPQIKVVIFSQDPSASSLAKAFGSRVLVDSSVDFTFLGTPFFHSMLERSRVLATDITVFVNPETILLPDFVSTLNFAYKLEHDWLLVAWLRNVSYVPFHLDDAGKFWLREDDKWKRLQEEIINHGGLLNCCDDNILMAWNSRNAPLHNGVVPPFLYGKGIHGHWVINEAASSELRFVFDASWAISSFSLNGLQRWSDWPARSSSVFDVENRFWEHVGNSHLGAQYGSLFFYEINYNNVIKLLKCDGRYLFVDTSEDIVYPSLLKGQRLWSRRVLYAGRKERNMACTTDIQLQNKIVDCSLGDQLQSSPGIDFPFPLESLLSKIADKNRTIVLSVAGYSYKDMLMSWVCRLRHLQVTNFLVCALDHETYQFSILQGLPVFYDASAPSNISFNDCHFGTKCFQRVTKMKSRMVLKILKLGYNVLLSDVDVYWFENPLPLLFSFGPAVLAAQSDEYNITGPINLPRRLNSGFYFARSDSSTIAAMEMVVKHAATTGLSEQPSFYDTFCGENGSNRVSDDICVEPETNLTIRFLDRNLFPNGAYLELWKKKNVKAACMKKGCLILHNNWISGRMKKLERQGGCRNESIKKKKLERATVPVNLSLQSGNMSVRVIHAGGREELYQHAVPASQLMGKYPGMCVARPEVFENPQESVLWPEENLLPGQKYLVIPSSTAQKLKMKHTERAELKGSTGRFGELSDVNITWDENAHMSEELLCSAKDFYASKDRWSKCKVKTRIKMKKPFVPPLPKGRFYRGPGWEPGLTSVQEVSP